MRYWWTRRSRRPKEGGGFADYTVVSLHCLRVYLDKSYRATIDLLSEMPHIVGEIGLTVADLPDHSTVVKRFDGIKTAVWECCCASRRSQISDLLAHKIAFAIFGRNCTT